MLLSATAVWLAICSASIVTLGSVRQAISVTRLLPLLALLVLAASAQAEDEVTTSPRGTFKIIQHYDGNWKQVLGFTDSAARTITLDEGSPWSARYYVSPDEQWVLRVQKSGSGDNISFLYHLDEHRQLWRREEQIGSLGFAYLATQTGLPRNLYHTGIEFESWNLEAGQLRFTISASDADQSGDGFHRSLSYKLRDGSISTP